MDSRSGAPVAEPRPVSSSAQRTRGDAGRRPDDPAATRAAEPSALEVSVGHAFGELAVIGRLELRAASGQVVGLVGPSGCGKTTLLELVAGLRAPSRGSIAIGAATEAAERLARCAYMPQRDLLLPWRRARANAALGAEISGLGRAEARRRADALFERFGLAGFERAWPSQLSGGMRQRLALLRTFLMPSQTLLLDEPFGALDAFTRREMHGWLQDVWRRDGRTVMLVTHDVEEALVLADVVFVFSRRPGHVVRRIEVALERPRTTTDTTSPRFVALKAELLTALEAQPATTA